MTDPNTGWFQPLTEDEQKFLTIYRENKAAAHAAAADAELKRRVLDTEGTHDEPNVSECVPLASPEVFVAPMPSDAPSAEELALEWDDRLEVITGKRMGELHKTEKVLFNIDIQMTQELVRHLTPHEAQYVRGWSVDISGFVRGQMLNILKGALKYDCFNGPPEYWMAHLYDEITDCVNYAIRARAVDQHKLPPPDEGVPPLGVVRDKPPHQHEPGGTTFPPAARLRERASHPDAEGVIPPGDNARYIQADAAAVAGCRDGK